MRVAQTQKLPRIHCPICKEELRDPSDRWERIAIWREHRRQHYEWGGFDE